MLQKSTLQFLQALNDNNNRPWFDENRKDYEAAKKDFEIFIGELLQACTPLIPELAERKAKDCIFRIFKDVRFSKDKLPYKNNFGASFGKGDKKVHAASFYIHLQPNNQSFFGGGIWMPEAASLKSIRQEIDYNFEEFEAILQQKELKNTFGSLDQSQKLKRSPKDYEEDNPAIDYLKLKSFTLGCKLKDAEMLQGNSVDKIVALVATLKPFVDFMNRSIT